jgi:hypothetical protein
MRSFDFHTLQFELGIFQPTHQHDRERSPPRMPIIRRNDSVSRSSCFDSISQIIVRTLLFLLYGEIPQELGYQVSRERGGAVIPSNVQDFLSLRRHRLDSPVCASRYDLLDHGHSHMNKKEPGTCYGLHRSI